MSQVGKLYKYYFGKIWQKNWLRIIIFTILIGVVWWFVIPFASYKVLKKLANKEQHRHENGEQQTKSEEEFNFSNTAKFLFGEKVDTNKGKIKVIENAHLKNRQDLEADRKLEEGKGDGKKMPPMEKMFREMFDS